MKRIVLYILAIIAVSALTFTGLVLYSSQAEKPVRTAIKAPVEQTPLNADTIFNLVNKERTKNGLQPLIRDATLESMAQERADDMVARNYFSHFDPIDGHKMIDDQFPGCVQSENIILVDNIGEKNTDAIKWWMNSTAHRDALLRADFTHTGVAVNGDIGVQHFCTR